MALINDPAAPTTITLVLADESGNTANKEFNVLTTAWDPTTGLIADLKTIRDNLVTAYNLLTDALIWKAFITLKQTDDTSLIGAAGSEIENLASIVVNLNTLGQKRSIRIPAPDISIFQGTSGPDKNKVNISNANLNTFIDFYKETGGSFFLGTGSVLDDTTPMDSGKRIHRKSTRG